MFRVLIMLIDRDESKKIVIFAPIKHSNLLKKKMISYIIGILGCIIIDAAFISLAIHHEAPVSDYILMGIFLPIADVAFLTFGSLCLKKSGKECLVVKLPDTVD